MTSNIFRYCYNFSSRFQRLFAFYRPIDSGIRTLYSLNALGIDNYIKTREKVSIQFREIADKFKIKMHDCSQPNNNDMIFTEDLKHMVHLVEANNDDLELLEQMMLKFCKQNKELRFGSFIFGPVVMRMYYYLDKPNEALKMFKHPDVGGFFDQLISFQILMDLLYKNKMYSEMLEVFDLIIDKQLQGSKYPKNSVVLVLAACYKLNTAASFDYAKKLWSNLNESGHYPVRRAGTFAAALALLQNSPDIALEILTSMKQQTYVTIRNLKVAALADLGRPDDALPILRSVLEIDSVQGNKHTFVEDIIIKVSSTIEKTNKADLKNEFEKIIKQLTSLGFISKEPLDNLLCKEITLHPTTSSRENHFQNRRPFNTRNQYNQRPSLRHMM